MLRPQLDDVHAAIAHLQRLSELFHKRRVQLAESVGLTDHQWGVLEEISTEHFMPSLFARRRESSPAAISKTLRQLIDKGFVVVSLSVTDARQRHYELTTKGKRVITRLRKSREDAIEQVWLKLPGEQIGTFNEFSEKLTAQLEQFIAQG